VALSILSGAHMTLFPGVLKLMKSRGIGDRLLTGGGIIPSEDMDSLARTGVGRLFGPGSSTQDIAIYIREWFGSQRGDGEAPVAAKSRTPTAVGARVAARKPAAKNPAARKPALAKSASRKSTARKPTHRKPVARKATPRKAARRK